MFPKHARSVMVDKGVRNVFDVASKLYDSGYKNVTMVVGADRIREFDTLLNKYNGVKARHGFYNFEKITVMNAGDRDPEAAGVAGVSGTKLRGFVKSGEFTSFEQNMPKKLSNADAKSVTSF